MKPKICLPLVALCAMPCFAQTAQSRKPEMGEVRQGGPAAGATSMLPAAVTQILNRPTTCADEASVWDPVLDSDVRLIPSADLFVMFHGNRFVVARRLVEAFEQSHPGVRVAYTAIPPVYALEQIMGRHMRPSGADDTPALGGLRPDVVMLPPRSLSMIGDMIEAPGVLYSQVSGLMMLARRDDSRVTGVDALSKNAALRIVLPGNQQRGSGMHRMIADHYGNALMDSLAASPRTGYSRLTHHRSIPARILTGCADIGFQYAQSRRFLERRFPGKFKFFPVPVKTPSLLADEDSLAAVVKNASHPALARAFVKFMKSPAAQSILREYGLAADRPATPGRHPGNGR